MTTQEKRAAIEKNYRIMKAALAAQEAWEAYRKAEDEERAAYHKWSLKAYGPDKDAFLYGEEHTEFHRLLDIEVKKEGLFKKAVNRFLKEIGRDPQSWKYAFDAQRRFNDCIRESEIHHICRTPLENISLSQFIIV